MVQITFVSSLKKVCSHKFLIFCVKNRYVLLYRLQGVKLGLKSVIFLCRIYLSMYFSPKNVFCFICWIFLFWHMNSTCLLSVTGEQKPKWQWYKDTTFPLEKSYLLKLTKCFWYKPSHSSSLIGCYNAIYVTLDKIQIRILIQPQNPNHYVYDSFFLYFLTSCFKWNKVASRQFYKTFV